MQAKAQNSKKDGRFKMKRIKSKFLVSLILFAAFAAWTAAVCRIDVQPVGPLSSPVGFAGINQAFHRWTGVHLWLYVVSDWLSLIPIGACLGFGMLGLCQWIRRRRLLRVDRDLLALGGFYVLVMAAYLLFEIFPVNFRPVLIGGALEASYPSSTTMLVLSVMPTAAMQLRSRIQSAGFRQTVILSIRIFTILMVAARLLSGVHWLSDIIGGLLLGSALVMLYGAVSRIQ